MLVAIGFYSAWLFSTGHYLAGVARRVPVARRKRARRLRRRDRAAEVPGIGARLLDRDLRRLLVLHRHLHRADDRRGAADRVGGLLLDRRASRWPGRCVASRCSSTCARASPPASPRSCTPSRASGSRRSRRSGRASSGGCRSSRPAPRCPTASWPSRSSTCSPAIVVLAAHRREHLLDLHHRQAAPPAADDADGNSVRSAAMINRQTSQRSAQSHVSPIRSRTVYNSLRPSIARCIVTSSAYSRSLPTGTPIAMRVTRTPSGFSSFAR